MSVCVWGGLCVVCWRQFESCLHRGHHRLIFNNQDFLQKIITRLKMVLVNILDSKLVSDFQQLKIKKIHHVVTWLQGSHPNLRLIVPAGWEKAGCFPCPPQSSIYHLPQWRHGGAGTLRFKVNPFKRLGLCYLVRSMCSVTTGSSGNLARRETVTECLIDFWTVVGKSLVCSEGFRFLLVCFVFCFFQ